MTALGSNADFWASGVTGVRYGINTQGNLAGANHGLFMNTILNSNHSGGINALLADGAVLFINDNIALATLSALAVKDDGQAVPAW